MKLARVFLSVSVSLTAFTLSEESLPEDVQRLVDQRAEAIARINKNYLEEREKLKLQYANKGDLDTANQVDSLIKTVSTPPDSRSLPNTKEKLQAYLTGTHWNQGRRTTATFGLNGLLKTNNVEATYIVTGKRTLTVTWDKKMPFAASWMKAGPRSKK